MKKYKFFGGAIVEAICSLLLIFSVFLPLQTMEMPLGSIFLDSPQTSLSIMDYANSHGSIAMVVYGFMVVCIINLVLKIWMRARWCSILVLLLSFFALILFTDSRSDFMEQGFIVEFQIGFYLILLSAIGLLIGLFLPTKYASGGVTEIPLPPEGALEQSFAASKAERGTPCPPAQACDGGSAYTSAPSSKKKNYYIIGAVVAAVIVVLFLFTGNNEAAPAMEAEEEALTDQPQNIEEIACDAGSEEPTVTDYKIKDKGEGDYCVLALTDGTYRDYGMNYSGLTWMEITKKADFDGDGNLDCIISWSTGGNCADCAGTDLVYFDEDEGFGQIKGIDFTSVEDWQGKPSIVHIDGLTMRRQILKDRKLVEVEKKSYNPGKIAKQFGLSQIFPEGNVMTAETLYDIDGDGVEDVIVLNYFSSHSSDFQPAMCVEDIKCSSGLKPESLGLGCGQTLTFLENKVKGMPDVLIDKSLYRWNGSSYQLMKYDGRKLIAD